MGASPKNAAPGAHRRFPVRARGGVNIVGKGRLGFAVRERHFDLLGAVLADVDAADDPGVLAKGL